MRAALQRVLDITEERFEFEPNNDLADRIAVLADECDANVAMHARIPLDGHDCICMAEWGVQHPIRDGNSISWKPAPGQLCFRSFESDPADLWAFTRITTGDAYMLSIHFANGGTEMTWIFKGEETHEYKFELADGVYILISKMRNGAPRKVYDRVTGIPIQDAARRAMTKLVANTDLYTLIGAGTFQECAEILLEVGPEMQHALASLELDEIPTHFCLRDVACPIRRADFPVKMQQGHLVVFDTYKMRNGEFVNEHGEPVNFIATHTEVLLKLIFSEDRVATRTYTFLCNEYNIFELRKIVDVDLRDNSKGSS